MNNINSFILKTIATIIIGDLLSIVWKSLWKAHSVYIMAVSEISDWSNLYLTCLDAEYQFNNRLPCDLANKNYGRSAVIEAIQSFSDNIWQGSYDQVLYFFYSILNCVIATTKSFYFIFTIAIIFTLYFVLYNGRYVNYIYVKRRPKKTNTMTYKRGTKIDIDDVFSEESLRKKSNNGSGEIELYSSSEDESLI